MLREIIVDTETTGLEWAAGDRVVEIGCVELVNRIPTGRTWHAYLNPERPMTQAAFAVHGLSASFLADKPVFAARAQELAAFIADARLVIHNAAFDVGFLNAEFARVGLDPLLIDAVVDTLALARRKHAGASNSLDALCGRYGIDNSRRTKHGALLDAEILAEVYIELMGGKQAALDFGGAAPRSGAGHVNGKLVAGLPPRPSALSIRISEADQAAHVAFVATLGPQAIWRDYLPLA